MPSIEGNTKSKFGHWTYPIVAVTGATITIDPTHFGCIITNRGGSALTATLPTPGAHFAGCWVKFYQVAAGDLVITCSNGMVALNDAAATSLTLGQNGEEIGNGVTMICDGTSWLTQVHLAAEAVTTSVGA